MLNDLKWQPLQHRRQNKSLTSFYKAANDQSPVNIPDYVKRPIRQNTRTHDQSFVQLRTNTDQYKYSFIPRPIRDWNALPPDLVHSKTADEFSLRLQKLAA